MIKKRRRQNFFQKIWDLKYLLIFILVAIVIFKLIILPSPPPLTGHWTRTPVGDHYEYNCTNCSDCNNAINNASGSPGSIIYLNTSISNQEGTCIDFNGKDNITFDCQSYSNFIDGDDAGTDYGISLQTSDADNNIIKNCNISDFASGIYMGSSNNNNTITNIIANNNYNYGIYLGSASNLINITTNYNEGYGIYLYTSSSGSNLINIIANNNANGIYFMGGDNNILTNITANLNSQAGIQFFDANNNTLTDITANNNSQRGIYLQSGDNYNNSLTNINSQENTILDIDIGNNCQNVLVNITSSGGRAIEYHNSSATIEDKELAGIILCGAHNSIVDNVTIIGSESVKNNFLLLHRTNNSIISNINSSGNYIGVRLEHSSHNTITNITANSNSNSGVSFVSSPNINNTVTNIIANSNNYGAQAGSSESTMKNITTNLNSIHGFWGLGSSNILIDLTSNSNSQHGFYFYGASNNNITNITANNNSQYGIYIYENSDNNTINNSRIENNTQYGIYFSIISNYPEYNLIYNNFFNNTVNYGNSTNLTNYFNTTKTEGTNIMGGPYIGGNYWAYPNGTGFSENCTDSNNDGICDEIYSLDGDNYDYLPLDEGGILCVESWTYSAWSACVGGTQTRTATDENDCGTTNDRLPLSQSCTVEPGGGGGITKDQPTESHMWTEITPDQPVEMIITNPEIDLTKITIDVSETVQDVSIKVTQIDVVPIADIKIGMIGDTYQSFKIETTGINDTNIESAIIEFKVNKTWISEQEGSAGDITFYRSGEKVNEWNELQTTLIDSDSDYYYFSAISPGLSIFVVVIDLSICNNNNICETELGEDEMNCPNDCKIITDDENKFVEIIKQPYLWIIIIVVLMIVIVLVVLITHLKRNKRLKQMMEK